MKRDMDLARKILLMIEEYPEPDHLIEPEMEGYSTKVVSYHFKLLHQAGLIEADESPEIGVDLYWWATSLTWSGHEFLDASRDETRWKKAKDFALNKGGTLSFEILKQVLIHMTKQAMGM